MAKAKAIIKQVIDKINGVKPGSYSCIPFETSKQFIEEVSGNSDQECTKLKKVGFDYLNIIAQSDSNSITRFKEIEAAADNEHSYAKDQFFGHIKVLKDERNSFCEEFERCRLRNGELRSAKKAMLDQIQSLEKEICEAH